MTIPYLNFAEHVADVRSLLRASGAVFSDEEIGDYLQRALDEYGRCVPMVQNCPYVVVLGTRFVSLDSPESMIYNCPLSTAAIIGAEYQNGDPIEGCQQIFYHLDARQLWFMGSVAFTQTQVNIRYRGRWLVRNVGDDTVIDPYPQEHRGIVNRLAAAFALEGAHADTMGVVAQCVTCESATVTTQTGTTTTETTSNYGKVTTTTNNLTDKTDYNSDQTRTDDLTAATTYGGVTTTDYGRIETMGGQDAVTSDFSETLTRSNEELVDAANPPITEHSILPYKVEHHSNKIEWGFCCSDFVLNITAASISIPIPALHFEGTDPGSGTLNIHIPSITFSTPLGDITTPEIDWGLESPVSIEYPNYDLYPIGPTSIAEHFQEFTINKSGRKTCTENLSAHDTDETQTTDYGRTTTLGGTDVATQSGSDSVSNTGTQTTARRGNDTTTHTGTQTTTQSGNDVVTSVTTPNLTTTVVDPNKNALTLLMLADRYFQLWQKMWNDAWRDLQCICQPCNGAAPLQPNATGYNANQIFGHTR